MFIDRSRERERELWKDSDKGPKRPKAKVVAPIPTPIAPMLHQNLSQSNSPGTLCVSLLVPCCCEHCARCDKGRYRDTSVEDDSLAEACKDCPAGKFQDVSSLHGSMSGNV